MTVSMLTRFELTKKEEGDASFVALRTISVVSMLCCEVARIYRDASREIAHPKTLVKARYL